LNKFIYFLEKRSEKKWTSNSFAFITVSNSLVENIKSAIKKEGISISNGYNSDEKIPTNAKTVLKDKIVFSYLGTMYEYQPIERVINAFKAISDNKKLKFVFQFYGIELIPSVKLKIQELIVGYDNVFVLKDKVNKKELRKIQQNSNFLFLTNYIGIDVWLVVELLDYSVTGIPIVLFPSDNGVMSNYIKTTNTGFSFNSEQELNCFIDEIVKNTNIELKINTSELEKYSSKKQLEQLSVLLNKINHD
jgi:glycosyltransferase involved in cell wall biosynthesis